ncbi:hypothetical protein D3C72_1420820 [compost metagenome]
MIDFEEMAQQHSAGAIVRHRSIFADLPSHKNDTELSTDFIRKWVIPFYMEIGYSEDVSWIDDIKALKDEITVDVCLALLGEFDWRPRLVGSYFAAVKGYGQMIDIIGTHLLKSEVCCVGHIYALVLAYFNTDKCIDYLNKYLDYYLTQPGLYFDQEYLMEAVLYADKVNQTENIKSHLNKWTGFDQQRTILAYQRALSIAKTIEQQKGKNVAEQYLKNIMHDNDNPDIDFSTDNFEQQIAILKNLNEYCR